MYIQRIWKIGFIGKDWNPISKWMIKNVIVPPLCFDNNYIIALTGKPSHAP